MKPFVSRLQSPGRTMFVGALLVGVLSAGASDLLAQNAVRSRRGLVVFYDFQNEQGDIIRDRSGVSPPLDLKINDLNRVRRSKGAIEIRKSVAIRSSGAATKLSNAIRRSGEFSIEVWIRPANSKQDGPARIVTLSRNSSERNFTLGQDGNKYDLRFRTTRTSTNGIPSVAYPSKSATTQLTHLVYTRERTGRTRLFLNGKQALESQVGGATSNWEGSVRFALANEFSGDRAWLGTYRMIAIYSRDLLPKEVQRHFRAGPNAVASLAVIPPKDVFEDQVAGILARRCLECHDTVNKQGALDLSRKVAAFQGGESGKVLVPGKLDESSLWAQVQANEMPKDREPLSNHEKQILKQWISAGAKWTLDFVDPADYRIDRQGGKNWLRRLTRAEYIATVRSAVGVEIGKEAMQALPPDMRADGFNNTAYNLNIDLKHVEAYARLAEIIVKRINVGEFAKRFAKNGKVTKAGFPSLFAAMGKWLLRGPLEQHELDGFQQIADAALENGGDEQDALTFVLEAMLQSPRFIYRIEHQRGDGAAWPASDYELASRISYIIWGGPPDAELMRAADQGDLEDPKKMRAQAHRMLQDPQAVQRSEQFIVQWLNLDRLANLRPNRERFPNWNASLGADMRAETIAYFKHVVWERQRPLGELLNTQVAYVTPQLAKHYGMPIKTNQGLSRYDVGGLASRGGILTQGSVLTVGGDDASMVTRGLFVLSDLLFSEVGSPPPGLDTTPVPSSPGRSHRAIAIERIKNSACGGCHKKFEPLAFGLEKYDGLGSFHEVDKHGNRLGEDGEIMFPGNAKPTPYKTTRELMDLLANSDRVKQCLTRKVTQFALGRPLVAADVKSLRKIHAEAQQAGGGYASLVTAIVMSDLVRMTRTETE